MTVGQISDFRSIQSMRLLLTGFDEEVTFRMIKFQLGRNTGEDMLIKNEVVSLMLR